MLILEKVKMSVADGSGVAEGGGMGGGGSYGVYGPGKTCY